MPHLALPGDGMRDDRVMSVTGFSTGPLVKAWRAVALWCVASAVACSHQPILYPNAHLNQVGQDMANNDIKACRQVATTAGSGPGAGKVGSVAQHAAMGAGAGAASGAVGGAITGSPTMGAEVGAASGAVWGFLSRVFSPSPPNPTYVAVVDHCLSERGYEVAGWK